MTFEKLETVPDGLSTDAFVLRPITADDAPADYAAVMESREFLRLWEQSTWPEDDFTVGANRADLEGLEQRHRDGIAFTYTVVEPGSDECLGCVYLFSTTARFLATSDITPIGAAKWTEYAAVTYFWVRASRLAEHLDRRLLAALRGWLATDWVLDAGHLIVTNEQFTEQVTLLEEAGLHRRFSFIEPDKPGAYLAYEA